MGQAIKGGSLWSRWVRAVVWLGASVVGTVALLVAASQAVAVTANVPVSPASGSTFFTNQFITLASTGPGGDNRFAVAGSSDVGPDGTLANPIATYDNDHDQCQGTSQCRTIILNFVDPGTYYWQPYRLDCDAEPDCAIEGPIWSFTLTSAPPSEVPKPTAGAIQLFSSVTLLSPPNGAKIPYGLRDWELPFSWTSASIPSLGGSVDVYDQQPAPGVAAIDGAITHGAAFFDVDGTLLHDATGDSVHTPGLDSATPEQDPSADPPQPPIAVGRYWWLVTGDRADHSRYTSGISTFTVEPPHLALARMSVSRHWGYSKRKPGLSLVRLKMTPYARATLVIRRGHRTISRRKVGGGQGTEDGHPRRQEVTIVHHWRCGTAGPTTYDTQVVDAYGERKTRRRTLAIPTCRAVRARVRRINRHDEAVARREAAFRRSCRRKGGHVENQNGELRCVKDGVIIIVIVVPAQ